ncbi:MAG: glycosyltransferase [Methanobacteriaceae archaeon]|nr:glycosyltransferase [Methanobacteriaceae archaeon]
MGTEKIRYVCIFPGLYNYILTKDVGMIPYILSRNYNYDSKIVTYDNDDYSYLNNTLKEDNFKLEYMENTGNLTKDVIKYLFRNSKKIDILQIYHLRYFELVKYILFYKLLNKNGQIYLKLDANNSLIDFLVDRKGLLPSLRRIFTKLLLKPVNIVSIETLRNYDKLLKSNIIKKDQLLYLPNGIKKREITFKKENIILYVGLIEKKNKSVHILLEAFKQINTNWKLILIGKMNNEFKTYLSKYYKQNPLMKEKIEYLGYISDKNELSKYYAKSSIYCSMSKSESFGISLLEAASYANYILATDVGATKDILNKTNYGKIINIDDVTDLKNKLIKTIQNWDNIKEDPYKIKEIIDVDFNWNQICKKLDEKIIKTYF